MTKKEIYAYFAARDFVDATTAESIRAKLSDDNAIAFTLALDPFVDERCPTCGATGYFRFQFLGRLTHSDIGHSWYIQPSRYIRQQFRRAFGAGMNAGAGKPGENPGILARLFAFMFVAWIRLAFGLLLTPIQAVLSLTSSPKAKSATSD